MKQLDLNNYVDNYCERLEPGLLSEPLNLFSNLAFFVAGILILYKSKRNIYSLVFGVLVIAVGIGSSLFHSIAKNWAMLADVIPIGILVLYFIFVYSKKVQNWSNTVLVLNYGFLVGTGFLTSLVWNDQQLNGSQPYLGVAVLMIVFGAIDLRKYNNKHLIVGAFVFSLSLALRSLDQTFCGSIPVGLHYFWHILNGLLLYIISRRLTLTDLKF